MPIALDGLATVTRGQEFDLSDLLSGGELLLVSVGISALACSDLIGLAGDHLRLTRSVLFGTSFVIVLISSLWYADVSSLVRDGREVQQNFVADGSLFLFGFSALSGLSCSVVSELTRWNSDVE